MRSLGAVAYSTSGCTHFACKAPAGKANRRGSRGAAGGESSGLGQSQRERLCESNETAAREFPRRINTFRPYVTGQNSPRTRGRFVRWGSQEAIMSMGRYWAVYDVFLGNLVLVERCVTKEGAMRFVEKRKQHSGSTLFS